MFTSVPEDSVYVNKDSSRTWKLEGGSWVDHGILWSGTTSADDRSVLTAGQLGNTGGFWQLIWYEDSNHDIVRRVHVTGRIGVMIREHTAIGGLFHLGDYYRINASPSTGYATSFTLLGNLIQDL